jgi:hypothetical protein
MTNQQPIRQQITDRKWRWIGHSKETKWRCWEVGIGLESPRREETRGLQKRKPIKVEDLEWNEEAGQQQKRMDIFYYCPMLYYKERQELMMMMVMTMTEYSMLAASNTGCEVGKLQYLYDCCCMCVLYLYLLVIDWRFCSWCCQWETENSVKKYTIQEDSSVWSKKS